MSKLDRIEALVDEMIQENTENNNSVATKTSIWRVKKRVFQIIPGLFTKTNGKKFTEALGKIKTKLGEKGYRSNHHRFYRTFSIAPQKSPLLPK